MPLTPLYQGPVYRQYSFGMVSVLADILVLPMREMSYGYQYRLIRKLRSLGFIGIGRYKKKAYWLYTAVGKSLFHKRVLFQLLHLDTSYIQIFQKYSNKIFAPLCKKPYFAHPIFYLNICNDDGCKIK